jgi:hypothetical protein
MVIDPSVRTLWFLPLSQRILTTGWAGYSKVFSLCLSDGGVTERGRFDISGDVWVKDVLNMKDKILILDCRLKLMRMTILLGIPEIEMHCNDINDRSVDSIHEGAICAQILPYLCNLRPNAVLYRMGFRLG